jgi:hypothetical protein
MLCQAAFEALTLKLFFVEGFLRNLIFVRHFIEYTHAYKKICIGPCLVCINLIE